jgi:hypothetical protein
MAKERPFLAAEFRTLIFHWLVAAVLILVTGTTAEDQIEALIERWLHFHVPEWFWKATWAGVGISGILIFAYSLVTTRFLIARRRIKLIGVLVILKLMRRKVTRETCMRSSGNSRELLATLVRAMGENVPPDGISPLRCFRRWASSEMAIYRVWENAVVSTGRDGSMRVFDGDPKGFYSIFALKEKAFNELRSNLLDYDDLNDEHMAELGPFAKVKGGEPIWLFVLDFEMITEHHNVVPTYLLIDLLTLLIKLLIKNKEVAGIAALAATERGEGFSENFGFRKYDNYFAGRKGDLRWKLFSMQRSDMMKMLNDIGEDTLSGLDEVVGRKYILDDKARNAMKAAFKKFRGRSLPAA